jgi:protein tyrosine phosphatase
MPIVNGKEVGLAEYSKSFLNRETVRNKYKTTDEYRSGHPNAKSDGDDLGRGENNGQIGTKTDITERNIAEAKNRYSKNNPYDSSKV